MSSAGFWRLDPGADRAQQLADVDVGGHVVDLAEHLRNPLDSRRCAGGLCGNPREWLLAAGAATLAPNDLELSLGYVIGRMFGGDR